jgi:hypothetical protein
VVEQRGCLGDKEKDKGNSVRQCRVLYETLVVNKVVQRDLSYVA